MFPLQREVRPDEEMRRPKHLRDQCTHALPRDSCGAAGDEETRKRGMDKDSSHSSVSRCHCRGRDRVMLRGERGPDLPNVETGTDLFLSTLTDPSPCEQDASAPGSASSLRHALCVNGERLCYPQSETTE